MTDRPTMTCEHCRQLLSDLVCGELNARDEAKARAHVDGCAECAKALASYQQAIWAAAEVPLDEPSAGLDARIMAAAEAHLRNATPAKVLTPGHVSFGTWLARAGEWAMSPQVAMASVLVLVVGIGLYALPLGQPSPRAALAPAAEPAPAPPVLESPLGTGATMPTPSKSEESREKKAASARAAGRGGARSADGEARRDRFAAPPPSIAGGPGRVVARRAAPDLAYGESASEGAAGQHERAKDDALAAPAKPQAPRSELEKSAAADYGAGPAADAVRASDKRDYADENAPKGAASAAEVAAATPTQPPAESAESARAAGAAEAPASGAALEPAAQAPGVGASAAASSPAPPAPVAPAPKPNTERADLARGMQALTAGRLPQAINVLTPLARTGSDEVRDLAQALLAEALHDANRCSEAVPWYARVVSRPTASARSLEMAADCYAKTGREAKAAELRGRARSR